jgi:hypothetical protein
MYLFLFSFSGWLVAGQDGEQASVFVQTKNKVVIEYAISEMGLLVKIGRVLTGDDVLAPISL